MADQLHPAFSFPDSQRSLLRLDQRHLKGHCRFCPFADETVKNYSRRAFWLRFQTMPVCSFELNPSFS